MTLPKGSRDLRSLRVLRNFRLRMRTPKGTPLVTFGSHVTTTKKKARGKPGMRRTYFRSGQFPDRASSGHVTDVTSGQKDSNMADMAPLPVAHAYMHARILPDKACA